MARGPEDGPAGPGQSRATASNITQSNGSTLTDNAKPPRYRYIFNYTKEIQYFRWAIMIILEIEVACIKHTEALLSSIQTGTTPWE